MDSTLSEVPEELYPCLDLSKKEEKTSTLFVSVTNNRIGSQLSSQNYAAILNRFSQGKNFTVVINCEPKDEVNAHVLGSLLQMPYRVAITETFEEFIHLLASVDALLIGDGGVMHLAAALNKPQVVLFGGTKIWEWAPLSKKAICLGDPHNVNYIDSGKIVEALYGLW